VQCTQTARSADQVRQCIQAFGNGSAGLQCVSGG
jgi:hypothetical protein